MKNGNTFFPRAVRGKRMVVIGIYTQNHMDYFYEKIWRRTESGSVYIIIVIHIPGFPKVWIGLIVKYQKVVANHCDLGFDLEFHFKVISRSTTVFQTGTSIFCLRGLSRGQKSP